MGSFSAHSALQTSLKFVWPIPFSIYLPPGNPFPVTELDNSEMYVNLQTSPVAICVRI